MRLFIIAACAIQAWGAPTTVAPETDATAELVAKDTTTPVPTKNASDVDQKIYPFDNQGFGSPFGGGGFAGAQNPFGNVFGGNPFGYSPFQTPFQNNNPYGGFPQGSQAQYPNQRPFQQYPGNNQFNPAGQPQFPVNQPSGQPVQPAQVLGQPGPAISVAGAQDGQNAPSAPSGANGQSFQTSVPAGTREPGQTTQGTPGSLPQGQPGQDTQSQLSPGALGAPSQIPQGAQNPFTQGAQGQFPQGVQGQFPQGAQGQFPAGGQNQFIQNPQGFQTGYPGYSGFPQASPFPQSPFDQASSGQPTNLAQNPNGVAQAGPPGSGPVNLGPAPGQPGSPGPQGQGVPGQNLNSQLPPGQLLPSGQGLPGAGQGPQGVPLNQGPQGQYNGQVPFQGQPQGQLGAPGQFQQGFPQDPYSYPAQFQNLQGAYPSQYYGPQGGQGQFFPQGSNGPLPFPGQGGSPGQFQGPQGGQIYPGQFPQGFYNQQPYPQGFLPQQQGFLQSQGPQPQQGFPQGQGPQQQQGFPQGQGFQQQFPQTQGPQQQFNPANVPQLSQQSPPSSQGQFTNQSPSTGLNGALPLPAGQEPSSGSPGSDIANPTQNRIIVPASPGVRRPSSGGLVSDAPVKTLEPFKQKRPIVPLPVSNPVSSLNNHIPVSPPGPPSPERDTPVDQPLPQASQGSELRSEAGAVPNPGPKQAEQCDASEEDAP